MIRHTSSLLALAAALLVSNPVVAQVAASDAPDAASDQSSDIVVNAKSTRSATAIPAAEIQKILPGVSLFMRHRTARLRAAS